MGTMTLEDMEATNLCLSPLGDNSSRAPLGDIPNLEHPSQMTPVPVPDPRHGELQGVC